MATEIEVPMRAVQVRLMCECGLEMTWTGARRPMSTPKYQHICDSGCGKEEWSVNQCPYIKYVEDVR